MNAKALSFFCVGLAAGLLLATAGFAWFIRAQRLNPADPGAPGTPGHAAARTTLKLAHVLDQNHPVHLGMEFLAKRVTEKSAGSVLVQIFPNGQLGSETENLEQLRMGALDMTKTSTAAVESFVPDFAVFGIPYAFRDEPHLWRVLEKPLGRELLAAGESKGFRGLCYYDAGCRSFYTVNRPILTPDDLKGLKIRVQKSETAIEMVKALGAAPTGVAWGELYTALQQGMVDGAENNPPSFTSNRHFEVCKHYSLNEHTMVPDILLISARTWQKLSPQVQAWLQESADESARYQRQLWAEKTKEALEVAQKQGVTIHRPDRRPFAEKVQPMHRRYDGTPVGKLLQRVRETE